METETGEGGWVRPEDYSIAALGHAAFLLSRNKLGALIVIEQQSGLKEISRERHDAGSASSAELLLAIFMPRFADARRRGDRA